MPRDFVDRKRKSKQRLMFLFQNLEDKQALQLFLEENMDNMWRKLQKIVMDFQSDTEEKRRNYNELLSKDKKGVAEVAENNKKIQRLMVSQKSWDFFRDFNTKFSFENFRKMLENSKRLLLNLEIPRTKDYLDYVRKGKN